MFLKWLVKKGYLSVISRGRVVIVDQDGGLVVVGVADGDCTTRIELFHCFF